MAGYGEEDAAAEAAAIAEFSASMGVPAETPAAATEETPAAAAAAATEAPAAATEETPAAAAAATATPDPDATLSEEEAQRLREEAAAEDPTELDAEGKILGKFNSTDDLAKSYKHLEQKFGQETAKQKQMREALESAGYTFTADGVPVAPAKAQAPQETQQQAQEQPVQQQPQFEVNPVTGNRIDPNTGFEIDQYGLVVVTDDQWQEFYEEDPVQANALHTKWLNDRERAIEKHQQQAVQTTTTFRGEIKATVAKQVSPQMADELDAALQAAIFDNPQIRADLKTNPEYIGMVAKAIAGDMLLKKYPELVGAASGKAADDAAKGRKIVAVEHGKSVAQAAPTGQAAASAAAAADPSHGLTAEEQKMAKDLGVSYAEYAEYK